MSYIYFHFYVTCQHCYSSLKLTYTMQLCDNLFSHWQLLKDLERIAGKSDLTMEIVSSWNNTWAQRIIELRIDSPKSSVRSQSSLTMIMKILVFHDSSACVHLHRYHMVGNFHEELICTQYTSTYLIVPTKMANHTGELQWEGY